MPFKFRQSNYYDDNNIRDFIFKRLYHSLSSGRGKRADSGFGYF